MSMFSPLEVMISKVIDSELASTNIAPHLALNGARLPTKV